MSITLRLNRLRGLFLLLHYLVSLLFSYRFRILLFVVAVSVSSFRHQLALFSKSSAFSCSCLQCVYLQSITIPTHESICCFNCIITYTLGVRPLPLSAITQNGMYVKINVCPMSSTSSPIVFNSPSIGSASASTLDCQIGYSSPELS